MPRLLNLRLMVAFLLSFLCCTSAFGTWQQGEATVELNGADVDNVRVQAIKNAIADASFRNGSFVAAEDVVLDGLLVSSKSVITTQGRIQRVEILSESASETALTVVVRVDISPILDCKQDKYTRSLLITQFQLLKPQQASNGGLFDLGRQISKRFENQLTAEYNQPKVVLIDKAFTNVRAHQEINTQEIAEKSLYLARQYGQQFVLFGFIRDISLFEQVKKNLFKDDVSLRRNFTIQLYVLDVYRHSMIFQEFYHSEADWDFNDDYSVDTNNSLFWRSDYGRTVLNTVNGAVADVANKIECERSFAQIINNAEHQLTINIGSNDGVKLGDMFTLYKKKVTVGVNGINSPSIQAYPSNAFTDALKVVQVDTQTAILESDSPDQTNSGDLLDLVSPMH